MARSIIKPEDGYAPLTCCGCSETFTPTRYDQTFCTKPCREATANFEKARAQKAYRALYHWVLSGGRMGKAPQGAGLGEITRMIREEWIAVDRKEGRLPPPLPFTNR